MLCGVFKGTIVNGPLINTLSEGFLGSDIFGVGVGVFLVINDQIYVD